MDGDSELSPGTLRQCLSASLKGLTLLKVENYRAYLVALKLVAAITWTAQTAFPLDLCGAKGDRASFMLICQLVLSMEPRSVVASGLLHPVLGTI